jgi:hypothetical protein
MVRRRGRLILAIGGNETKPERRRVVDRVSQA